jgi:hypothetical protein
MKGKAYTQPQNCVVWENGYRSNMPDWITARECAVAHELLRAAQEARTCMLAMSTPDTNVVERIIKAESVKELWGPRWDRCIDQLFNAIGNATGLDPAPVSIPMPPGFAK